MSAKEPAATTSEKGIDIELLSINTVRTLSMDAVQKANSGHPGTPMALAPAAYTLYMKHMKFNPGSPGWFDRDRFVLSCGHASMLLYSMLHLTGFDLSLEDLRNFRQWESKTPGHPEHGMTAGVETTTGPLGQGFANGIGFAIAERFLAARYNRPGHEIVNHRTYAFCSDGDLMEGVSSEAASIAGHLGLGKIVYLYDDNHITIEGDTALAFDRENVAKRFEAYGWHVVHVADANDVAALSRAFAEGEAETARPTLIICRSHIGYPSPHKQDTAEAHGSPLGEEEIRATKKVLGWPEDAHFLVPPEVAAHMGGALEKGKRQEDDWKKRFASYASAFPELARELEGALAGKLPEGWDKDLPSWKPADGEVETRKAGQKVLNKIAPYLPTLIGGSADLSPSTNTVIDKGGDFGPAESGRNFHWGIREHGMCSILNGMALHGGVRPYGASFLMFTDYARPAIRLAALMRACPIYVFTHDSIGLGEDGPTHQPIEILAALRTIPNMTVIRPGDPNETAFAWKAAIEHQTGPVLIALTRQKVPVFDQEKLGSARGVAKGGYVLADSKKNPPDVILIGTGSETQLALQARELLAAEGIDARAVSLPSWELFAAQPKDYRDSVLPPAVKARVAVEAGCSMGWSRWTGENGAYIGIDHFGASAPAKTLYEKFGITAKAVADAARAQVKRG